MPWTFTLRPGRKGLAALVAAALGLLAFLAAPGALVLDIPVDPHSGGGPFWTERQQGRLGLYDHWSHAHVQRQTGATDPGVHPWRTPEEAFAHFDRWLTGRGWQRAGSVAPPEPLLPEAWFLAPDNTRLYYRRHSHDRVLLAIWPRNDHGWLNVTLATSRPTLIERIRLIGERKKESEEND